MPGRSRVDARTTSFSVDITVPDGVSAEVDLPGAPLRRVGRGRHRLTGGVVGAVTSRGI